MLVTKECEEHLAKVRAAADELGSEMRKQLEEMLERLDNYNCCQVEGEDQQRTQCHLYRDFAPLSFGFAMERRESPDSEYKMWFHGGLIFHGNHDNGGDGSAPTFSVSLTPCNGWSIHT